MGLSQVEARHTCVNLYLFLSSVWGTHDGGVVSLSFGGGSLLWKENDKSRRTNAPPRRIVVEETNGEEFHSILIIITIWEGTIRAGAALRAHHKDESFIAGGEKFNHFEVGV